MKVLQAVVLANLSASAVGFVAPACSAAAAGSSLGRRGRSGAKSCATAELHSRSSGAGQLRTRRRVALSSSAEEVTPEIESPFSASGADIESPFAGGGAAEGLEDDGGPLPLTLDNVEMVLDKMRPYLMSDGGNVRVVEIDGPVVKLELEGACGSCPSSTMTMKMGLERSLRERIPEISAVVQSIPEGPELCEEEVEKVLDGVRPFLSVAGGSIHIDSLRGLTGMQPAILLRMEGKSSSLRSVKMEIMQRLQKNFMTPGMRVEWV